MKLTSTRTRLLSTLTVTGSLVALALVLTLAAREIILKESTTAAYNKVESLARYISGEALEFETTMQTVADAMTIMRSHPAMEKKTLESTIGYYPYLLGIRFEEAMGPEDMAPYWSEPYSPAPGADRILTYSCPMFDEKNEVRGKMLCDVSMEWISALTSKLNVYKSSYLVVESAQGHFLSNDAYVLRYGDNIYDFVATSTDPRFVKSLDYFKNRESGTILYTYLKPGHKILKTRSLLIFEPMDNGWTLATTCDYAELFSRSRSIMFIVVVTALILILLLFILMIVSLRHSEEKNERFESELSIARNIQMEMVPSTFPRREEFDVYGLIRPSRDVGGDFFDYTVRGRKLYITVGDVSGKGVPAAMVMSFIQSAGRLLFGMKLSSAEFLGKLNERVSEGNDSGMFATYFIAKIDLDTHEMIYCNAGHNPIIIAAPGCEPRFLKANTNMALGVIPDFWYDGESLSLEKGTKLLLYTDGVNEAEAAGGRQFGNERLLGSAARAFCLDGSQAACESILADVQEFTAGNLQNDDITLMAVELK